MVKSPKVVCEHGITSDTLSAWHDNDLSPAEAQKIGKHVRTCSACRTYLAEIDAVISALQAQPVPALTESLWQPLQARKYHLARRPALAVGTGKRLLQGLGAVAAVILLIVGFAEVLNRNSGSGGPAPTPQVINNESLIVVESNLSFGSVTIDGATEVGKPPFFINLPSGEVTVTYAAPPFRTESCLVSWAVPNSHPPLNVRGASCYSSDNFPEVRGKMNGQPLGTSNALNFEFGLTDLPSNLQSTALDFVNQVVTPVSLSQTVPPGQYYATGLDGQGMILSRQATTSLSAQVSVVLPTAQDLASPISQCPVLICASQGLPLEPNSTKSVVAGKLWEVTIPRAMNWQFSLPGGQLVGSEHVGGIPSELGVTLVLDSHEMWHLAQPANLLDELRQPIPQTFCGVEENELQSALAYHHAGNQYSFNQPNLGVPAGCEIQITQDNGPLIGTVVWRFGVLLAADAKTQSVYPWLPLAPQAEVDAVS
ncbi:MAG: anti-sigma factor family protein [Ktedonobacterales bacterium]